MMRISLPCKQHGVYHTSMKSLQPEQIMIIKFGKTISDQSQHRLILPLSTLIKDFVLHKPNNRI